MKKIIFILLITVIFGCDKNNDPEPKKNAKTGLFRLEFHGADTTMLRHNYLINSSPVVQKSPVGDTVKVYEFQASQGQNIQAYISSTSQHGYWKQIRAVWQGDTVFYQRQHSDFGMNITLE
jgi:hypothetical protein